MTARRLVTWIVALGLCVTIAAVATASPPSNATTANFSTKAMLGAPDAHARTSWQGSRRPIVQNPVGPVVEEPVMAEEPAPEGGTVPESPSSPVDGAEPRAGGATCGRGGPTSTASSRSRYRRARSRR